MKQRIALKTFAISAVLAASLAGCGSNPSNCTNVPGAVVGGVAGGAVVGSNYGC